MLYYLERMKSLKRNFVAIFALFLGVFYGCQPDDICEKKVTTPRLVVRFYDFDTPKKTKSVEKLIVFGRDSQTILINSTTDSIALPLKLNEPTSFVMVSDATYNTASSTITAGNVSTIHFTYNTENQFINKACGFRVVYNTLSATTESTGVNWIKSIVIKNNEVKDEASAKVHIYH